VKVFDTALAGLKLLEPRVFNDDRGFFLESWNARAFAAAGIDADFVQDNHSRSAKGVLRGLHYQIQSPQGKLVRVVAGAVFDVAVDLRRSSETFGRWVGYELSAENKRQAWIPSGFAHGFLSLQDGTELLYKCTDFYSAQAERSLIWNDLEIGIDWPLNDSAKPLLSDKDAAAKALREAEVFA
jgi:dTDP-4-dehydrorhamnose 3,5-epimerase